MTETNEAIYLYIYIASFVSVMNESKYARILKTFSHICSHLCLRRRIIEACSLAYHYTIPQRQSFFSKYHNLKENK